MDQHMRTTYNSDIPVALIGPFKGLLSNSPPQWKSELIEPCAQKQGWTGYPTNFDTRPQKKIPFVYQAGYLVYLVVTMKILAAIEKKCI